MLYEEIQIFMTNVLRVAIRNGGFEME